MSNVMPIARERVPQKLLQIYDWCGSKETKNKTVDTEKEIARFMSEAELELANKRMTENEYKKFLQDFAEEKSIANKYYAKKYVEYYEQEVKKTKEMIAQMEKDIEAFKKYKEENPKTSFMHEALNVGEFLVKTFAAIVTLPATIITPEINDYMIKSMDKTAKNGAITSSEYNKLGSKVDYSLLRTLIYNLKILEDKLHHGRLQLQRLGINA